MKIAIYQYAFCVAVALLTSVAHSGELQALDEDALSGITGQSGIALDLELRINADATGAPLASLSNCTGVGNPCVMGIQFNNRGSGGGEWLMLKDYYGIMKINSLHLDGAYTPGAASPYTNHSRFYNQSGTDCLTSGTFPNCAENGQAVFAMSFAGSPAIFEDDILWHLNVGRMAIEYGPTGYDNDTNGSFLGLRVTDLNQTMARIDVDGTLTLSGF
ncbi:MAG: hypothetical protein P1U67_04025 [Alcanivoracaceae bacterium]|nr:hypothetical protein [Alcanivoracaceae bacterium]